MCSRFAVLIYSRIAGTVIMSHSLATSDELFFYMVKAYHS